MGPLIRSEDRRLSVKSGEEQPLPRKTQPFARAEQGLLHEGSPEQRF